MSKHKAKTANRPPHPNVNKPKPVIIEKPRENKETKKKNLIYILTAIILTAIVYSGSLKNGWIRNWDDNGYVLSHKQVHELTLKNIKYFFTDFNNSNYHPLTNLSNAIEYKLSPKEKDRNGKPTEDPDPFLFHLNNLLLHLLNVWLVFVFVKMLTKKIEIAGISAILFGIHPMHVESVAWIAERKDVLYSFFFLASMIYYLRYLKKNEYKPKYLIYSFLAFALSLLSKSAATTLPVVLLLIDFYVKRKWSWKILLEKTPFFALSFLFGILAIFSQESSIQNLTPLYSWFERPLLACYSTITYFYKLIVPINFSAMYSYPERISGHLPMMFYIIPAILLVLFYLVYYSKKYTRDIIFGTLFFFVTISLVLQLLPVGGAIVSERYSYIPYIGLFIIIGKGYVYFKESKFKYAKSFSTVFSAIIVAGILIYSVQTFQRIKIWKDGKILFTDVVKKYPNLPFAYDNLGYFNHSFGEKYYENMGYSNPKQMALDSAIACFNKCLALDSTYYQSYDNLGMLLYNKENPDYTGALKNFTKALKYKANDKDALVNRANCYSTLKDFGPAIPDYDKYIKLMPDCTNAYLWRCIALYNVGRYDEAFADINKFNVMRPNNSNTYLWRGVLYMQKKDYKTAITNFDSALQLNPDLMDVYNWRGLSKFSLKMYNEAISDYTIAIDKKTKDPTLFINRSSAYFQLKNYKQAFIDYCSAGNMRYALDKEYFFRLKALAGK